MISICSCLITGFSFKKSQRSSFLKKPLVAISLVVIITMCLTAAEAAPRAASTEHRQRHHRKQTIRNEGKRYKDATEAVILRLKHNSRNYGEQLKVYKGFREMRNIHGNPKWLPKINLVQIHFHPSKNLRSRFRYVMPKFYKHVRQYRAMFDVLLNHVKINAAANLYSQLIKRDTFLNSTLNDIDLLITDLTDAMNFVNFSIPEIDDAKMNIEALHRNVDSTEFDFQDQIAFRAYENLISSWRLELRCWRRSASKKPHSGMCARYEEEMWRKNCSRLRLNKPTSCQNFKPKH